MKIFILDFYVIFWIIYSLLIFTIIFIWLSNAGIIYSKYYHTLNRKIWKILSIELYKADWSLTFVNMIFFPKKIKVRLSLLFHLSINFSAIYFIAENTPQYLSCRAHIIKFEIDGQISNSQQNIQWSIRHSLRCRSFKGRTLRPIGCD